MSKIGKVLDADGDPLPINSPMGGSVYIPESLAVTAPPELELLHAAMDESDDLSSELTNLKTLALKLVRAVQNELSKGTIVLCNEGNWLLDDIQKAIAEPSAQAAPPEREIPAAICVDPKCQFPDITHSVEMMGCIGEAQAVAGEPPALSHTRSCPLLRTMSEDDCTCGLQYRIELQTERELHNAWRKRAEEAELRESVLSKRVADLKEEITLIEALLDKRTEIIRQFLATPEANAGMKVMLDIYEGWQDHALGIEFPPTSHEEAFSVAAHRINCAIAHALRTKPTQGRQGDCKSTVRDIQIGEICRARCGAPARFIGNMKALFISSMCNELQEDAAMPPSGNELNFPLPSDADVERVSGKKIPRENPTLADCTELTRKTLTENWKKREAAAPEPVAEPQNGDVAK